MRGYILYTLVFLCLSANVVAQSINTDFGKNRVQYHDDFNTWYKYETENFLTFYYGKSRNVAEVAMQMAEQDHAEIQNILEHRINDKIRILVYTDISDVKQSNIGLDETFTSKPGETKIIGNKMFVYFDGNHQHLRRQIREGIASVYLSAMQFGDSFQEMVQNAVLLNLPEWYKRGIISYIGAYWDSKLDDELRDIIQENPKYWNFKKLAEDYPKIAGHSMWFYMDQNYGKSSISNIIYLTRITRDIDNALLYVLNEDIEDLTKGWEQYYRYHYQGEPVAWTEGANEEHHIAVRKKKYVPASSLRLNPHNNTLAYVANNIGKARVKIKDLDTGKEKTIFKFGHKNGLQATDYDYPAIAWSPDGDELTIIYERKDVIYLRKYHVPSGKHAEQIIPTALQRIYSVDYIDEDRYLFSANTDGYSDLYSYNFVGRQFQRITNDFYDDLDATIAVVGGREGILFSSNRTNNHLFELSYDTIIPDGDFNLFFYDLEADDKSLLRLTNTPGINERYPAAIGGGKIVYLADKSGITNRYVYDLGTNQTWPSSNLSRNIIRHHAVLGSDKYAYMYYHMGEYKVYLEKVDWAAVAEPFETRYHRRIITSQQPVSEAFIPLKPEAIIDDKDIPVGLLFQAEFDDPPSLEPIRDLGTEDNATNGLSEIFLEENTTDPSAVQEFVDGRAKVARLAFRLDNVTTKLDNEFLFEGLESFTGNSDQLLDNPMGMLFKANVKDLFEDYSITAGARYPLTFDGSEYFITFENRKALIDRTFALYRKAKSETTNANIFPVENAKKTSLLALAQWKYPFDVYRSFRLTTSLRFDRFHFLASNPTAFEAPIDNENRLTARLEYVYDNSIDIALNVKHGTRYKIYSEVINEFELQVLDGFEADVSSGLTGIIGYDARHYIPLLKHSVIALRSAGATSFGTKKNLYYIGAINNTLTNPFNEDVPVRTEEEFAYKTNVFHLRGFDSNIRNGASYALVNTEIRIPIFRYLMGKYDGSSFLRNFQLVGFFDAGTAWYGTSPYSEENPLNTVTVSSGDLVEINLRYFRDPIVMGFGGGARASLFGYFLRFDVAHGVETRRLQDLKFYFSIGTDF